MKKSASATWSGTLKEGSGTLDVPSGAFTGLPYTHKGRFVDESGQSGTSPEELIAAAHSGCFAMQLGAYLGENGTPAERLAVTAVVEIVGGNQITSSALKLEGHVPNIDTATFQELAEKAKTNCPVLKALGAITVTLEARLA